MRKSLLFAGVLCLLLVACDTAAADTASKATATSVVPADSARTVLKRAVESICPPPKKTGDPDPFVRDFNSSPTQFTASCSPAAGHSTTVTLRWFGTDKEARSAFDTRRKQNAAGEFHGYPSASWEEDSKDLPGDRLEYRIRIWQSGAWLVEISAFDDTASLTAPDPDKVSEEVYQAGTEAGLFLAIAS